MPYGSNIEGIAAGSYIYFNRDLKDLNLIDILSLAVIPQNPLKRGGNDINIFKARKYLFTEWLTIHPQDIIYNVCRLNLIKIKSFLLLHRILL